MKSSLKYWIWLSALVKILPRRRLRLLEYYQDPALLWEASEAELKELDFCTPATIKCITDREIRKKTDEFMLMVSRCDADVITLYDKAYPKMLKYIADPPVVLYCRGKIDADAICVAVVGSRRATSYGAEMAVRLSKELARHGVTVVSGMARGIDTKAHIGALQGGGKTIAVLGCGVDVIYPQENGDLMNRIIQSGAVISEYLPGAPPIPFNFPARNRIISGLSNSVVIVEANERSGSLITADFALEQGRDVFAVPGNINSINSAGANRLIRDGARMITTADDILDELDVKHERNINFLSDGKITGSILGNSGSKLDLEGRTIAQRLLNGPAHIDVIARDCGISVQLASSVLMMLELSGFVEQMPGKLYRLAE